MTGLDFLIYRFDPVVNSYKFCFTTLGIFFIYMRGFMETSFDYTFVRYCRIRNVAGVGKVAQSSAQFSIFVCK